MSGILLAIGLATADEAFDHKSHAPLKLKCVSCHEQAESGNQAGFPALTRCRTCHTEMASRRIPVQRVYELPEFVFFSHGKHATGKVECHRCHGDVAVQTVVQLAQPLKMKWCIDCHKQQKAAVTCTICHELGQ